MTGAALSLSALVEWTCPSCPTSRLVSAIVCDDDFWRNLGAIIAPFPVFTLLAIVLHRLGRRGDTGGAA